MELNIKSFIFSKGIYYFYMLDLQNLKMDWENPYNITFEKYNEKDHKLLEKTLKSIETKEQPFTIDEAKSRLDDDHMLYVAKKDNYIIGFYWIATEYIELPFIHASICLNNDEVVTYNTYILEEYRGKRIHNKLKSFTLHDLEQKGYKKKISYINSMNKSSLAAMRHFAEERYIGKLTSLMVLTLDFRYHNLSKIKIVIHGGPLRLWKGLFRKIKEKYIR